ncbi:MAG TPA: hypothetical protein VNX21_02900 [Candidatus Thermoplasmatota archaeon]|nr:hypothetical protein [Candidatus Thermoplasmatota archaeon]
MLRALPLALLALGALLPPAQAAGCDPTGQACWSEWSSGHCSGYGQGWTDVRARNVMLGFPLVVEWHTRYTCTANSRTDAWNVNATAGERGGVRTEWTSQPARDWTLMRVQTTGPQTNATTLWYADETGCTLWTLGTVAGTAVNDRRACPVGPPDAPVGPWDLLLP